MQRLSSGQFKFLDATGVQAIKNDKGEIFIQLSGVMKNTKISYGVAKLIATGVADEGKYIPPLEDFANADTQK